MSISFDQRQPLQQSPVQDPQVLSGVSGTVRIHRRCPLVLRRVLRSLQPRPPPCVLVVRKPTDQAPGSEPADLIAGEGVYQAKCSECHGADLRGTEKGPSYLSEVCEPSHHSDAAFLLAVRNGSPAHHWNYGDMAPVEGLTDRDVENLTGYVRSIQQRGGFKPTRRDLHIPPTVRRRCRSFVSRPAPRSSLGNRPGGGHDQPDVGQGDHRDRDPREREGREDELGHGATDEDDEPQHDEMGASGRTHEWSAIARTTTPTKPRMTRAVVPMPRSRRTRCERGVWGVILEVIGIPFSIPNSGALFECERRCDRRLGDLEGWEARRHDGDQSGDDEPDAHAGG